MSNETWISRRRLIGGAAAAVATAAAANATPDQARAAAALPPDRIPVAFLMDEAATMMDFAGPWEVLQDAAMAGVSGYYLYTVAPRMAEFNTTGTMVMNGAGHGMKGLRFTPDFTLDDAPQPRVIVMGAQTRFAGPDKIAWLRRAAPGAEIVLAVCTGNFIAAHAGLLDGLQATTHHRFYDEFARTFPNVRLVRDARVVDNGKLISGGGITAGIDAALHVVRRHFGDAVAQRTIDYMEYRGACGTA